jgi:hypothetical protein
MESNRKHTHAVLLIVTLTVGLLITFTARITGASGSAERVRGQQTPAQPSSPQNANSVAVQTMSAPFRDGLFVGRITSEHGNEPHISVGRWAFARDRTFYASGYRQGYNQQIVNAKALHQANDSSN